MVNRVPRFLVIALTLLPLISLAQSEQPDAILKFFRGNPVLEEFFPGETVKPPYEVEIWVNGVHGLNEPGTKRVIENYLGQDLGALGDVECVNFLSARTPRPSLRLRVWFSQLERPIPNDCFNMTLAVVVGKVNQDNPLAEYVIDAYGLAGIAPQDVGSLCQKIATRLDVNILARLRRMNSSSTNK